MDVLVVLVTTPTDRDARIIARKLVEEKLCACVNIIPVDSIFRWKGSIETYKEYLMIIKTTKQKLEKLEKRVKELHKYEVPEIIALEVIGGSKDYLDWLKG